MTGSSVLPVTLYKGKLYFLFGKENPMEDSAKGFSDFGGGVEKGEDLLETAMREGGEELTGFLGDGNAIKRHIKSHGGIHKLHFDDYHVHLFYLPYDPQLPIYYNQNHMFLWKRMDKHVLNKTKLFEKIEIDWFSLTDIQKRRHEFRKFYRAFLDVLASEASNIKQFVQSCMKRGRGRSSGRCSGRGRGRGRSRGGSCHCSKANKTRKLRRHN